MVPFVVISPFDANAGFLIMCESQPSHSGSVVPLTCEQPLVCIFVTENRSFLGGGGETPPSSESDDDASIA